MYKRTIAKYAALAVSTGAASTGGYYLVTELILGQKWITAEKSGKTYDDETMGKIYGKYLLSTGTENKKIWKEILKRRADDQSISSNSDFGTHVVTSDFSDSSTTQTSLNNKCESQYKKKMKGSDGDTTGTIDPEGDLWKALWILCSLWNPKWLTVANSSHTNDSIGKLKSHEFLSTNGEDNKDLWNSKNSDFFALTAEPTAAKFKELYKTKNQKNRKDLRSTCEDAYKVKSGDNNQPTADEVLKYCSMKPIS